MLRAKGKCVFRESWLYHPAYNSGLARVSGNSRNARCVLCRRDFDISNMGESALKSHAKGEKHKQLVGVHEAADEQRSTPRSFLGPRQRATSGRESEESSVPKVPTPVSTLTNITSFVPRTDCLKAEVLWALKVKRLTILTTRARILPASLLQCFRTARSPVCFRAVPEKKCAYLCSFRIAPHFKTLLLQSVNKSASFVLLFDESQNNVTKTSRWTSLFAIGPTEKL